MLWQFPPIYLVLNTRFWPILTPPTPPVHHTACGHPPSHRSGPATRTTPPPLHPSHSSLSNLLFIIFLFFNCPATLSRRSTLGDHLSLKTASKAFRLRGPFLAGKVQKVTFSDPPSGGQK